MKVKGHKNNLAIQKEYFQIVYYIPNVFSDQQVRQSDQVRKSVQLV